MFVNDKVDSCQETNDRLLRHLLRTAAAAFRRAETRGDAKVM